MILLPGAQVAEALAEELVKVPMDEPADWQKVWDALSQRFPVLRAIFTADTFLTLLLFRTERQLADAIGDA